MFIKVTGYLEIADEDFDAGPMGPLTSEAWEHYNGVAVREGDSVPRIDSLDDLEFEEDDR